MSLLFGEAIHAAFIVQNIDAELERVLGMGVGPIYVMRNIRPAARYRGQRHDPLITAAFMYSGGLQLEFVQQHDDTPSAYLEFLQRQPAGGFHHLAYFCDSFESALAKAGKMGKKYNTIQEYIWPSGTPYEIYVEPADETNPLLVQLMVHSAIEKMFELIKKEAAKWDGKEPIRDAMTLLSPDMTTSEKKS